MQECLVNVYSINQSVSLDLLCALFFFFRLSEQTINQSISQSIIQVTGNSIGILLVSCKIPRTPSTDFTS